MKVSYDFIWVGYMDFFFAFYLSNPKVEIFPLFIYELTIRGGT